MFLVQLLNGPQELLEKDQLVHNITSYIYFKLKSGKWVYYYLTSRNNSVKEVKDVNKPETKGTSSKYSWKSKNRDKSNYKKVSSGKKFSATYQYCKYFGEVDELHQDIQTYLNARNRTSNSNQPKHNPA